MASSLITCFESRYRILERIARKYVSWRFELHELINQMWLSKAVRNARYEHHVVRAAVNAYYDYLRSQTHRGMEAPPCSLKAQLDKLDDVDAWEDFDVMSRGWTHSQRLIITLRADWFTWDEIAKITGYTSANARYKVGNIDTTRAQKWRDEE